jgi:hypothetical protein
MTYRLLSPADINELNAAWAKRCESVFEKAVVKSFLTEMMMSLITKIELKEHLLMAIADADSQSDIWITTPHYSNASYFTAYDFGDKRLSIKHILYETDALSQLATAIGPGISVVPVYQRDQIYFKIEYLPTHMELMPSSPFWQPVTSSTTTNVTS